MKKYILSTICISIMFAACSSDDYVADNGGKQRLLLTTTVDAHDSRAANNLQLTQFKSGESLIVWPFQGTENSTEYLYAAEGVKMIADGSGGLKFEDGKFLYADPDKEYNIWAFHPYSENIVSQLSVNDKVNLPCAVQSDQSTDENYLKSDFCAGHLYSVRADGSTYTIPMRHLYSKITINIVDGDINDGYTLNASGVTNIIINNIYRYGNIKFCPKHSAYNTDPVIVAEQYTGRDKENLRAGINTLNCSIIVPPQDIPSGHDLFTIGVTNRPYFTYKHSNSLKLESGKEYIFTVSYALPEMSVKIEVHDWNATDTKTGTISY